MKFRYIQILILVYSKLNLNKYVLGFLVDKMLINIDSTNSFENALVAQRFNCAVLFGASHGFESRWARAHATKTKFLHPGPAMKGVSLPVNIFDLQ